MKNKEKQNKKKTAVQELMKEVDELQKKLKKMNVDRHVKEVKNTRETRNIRRRIAILLTYIQEMQLIQSK